MRTARSAVPRRAAAGAASSAGRPSSTRVRNTLPSTPGPRASAFAIRRRPSLRVSTHWVTSWISRRSGASAGPWPTDQYAIAPTSSRCGQQRTKNARAVSVPQRPAIASSGSKSSRLRSARSQRS